MRVLILLLFISVKSYGQIISLPSSGPLSMFDIAEALVDMGELSEVYLDPATPYTLKYLVSVSHLADTAAPHKISDFYSYTNLQSQSAKVDASVPSCSSSLSWEIAWLRPYGINNGMPVVGTVLYLDGELTDPVPNGFYSLYHGGETKWYQVTGGAGEVSTIGDCGTF